MTHLRNRLARCLAWLIVLAGALVLGLISDAGTAASDS